MRAQMMAKPATATPTPMPTWSPVELLPLLSGDDVDEGPVNVVVAAADGGRSLDIQLSCIKGAYRVSDSAVARVSLESVPVIVYVVGMGRLLVAAGVGSLLSQKPI